MSADPNEVLEALAEAGSPDGQRRRSIWDEGFALLQSDGRRRRALANDALLLYHGNGRHTFDGVAELAEELGFYDPPGYNVIQAATDTKVAHIVRNRVRPMFVTEKGDSELKAKALGMQRAVETVFQQTGVYGEVGTSVCRDGCLFEAGGMKWTPDYANGRVLGERVFAHDVLVSPVEARLGAPRQIWHAQLIDRAVLRNRYRDDERAVRLIDAERSASSELLDRYAVEGSEVADMVLVLEYWRLPAGAVSLRTKKDLHKAFGRDEDGNISSDVDPGHDGQHAVYVEGGPLRAEPWPFDYFPISWFKPMRTAIGYWSRGVPETLAGAQLELNRLNERIAQIIHMHAVPRLVVSRMARLNKAKLTNGLSDVLEVHGQPSQAIFALQPPSVPAELFRRIEDITRWAEKQVGLSEMSISARKPAGVDHAPGMQHLADTESIRHTPDFRAWEDFHCDAARMIVDCLRLLDTYGSADVELLWGNSKQLQRIKWSEVDLPRERYHLRVWPTNLLPQTPGARKSFVLDLMNAGLFNQQQALLALDFPDVEALMGDTTAALENIERKLEAVKRGETVVPEPYMNLQLAKLKAADTINRMEADGEDQDAIDRVRQFWEDCDELLMRAAQAAAPPPAAEGAPPEGPPPDVPPPDPNTLPPAPLQDVA